MPSPMRVEAADQISILFVDPGAEDSYLPMLRRRFEVTAVPSEEQAVRALRAFQPTMVITELALPDGDGVSLCRQSKAFPDDPPSVLAMTSTPERAPEALKAGCDAILMKPFAPNLLYARIGLLLRLRAKALQERAMWQRAKSAYLIEHTHRDMAGTNVVHQDAVCPSCEQGGAVSFDAASHRRMWYACLPCEKVWMAAARRGE
jgi:DNA-binding response OmpR family regulator